MMKKYINLLFLSLFILGCNSNDDSLSEPSEILNVEASPVTGGALLRWEVPSDSSFTYVEIEYLKNNKQVFEKVSKYTDSVVIGGLINKEPVEFTVSTVNETNDNRTASKIFTTQTITPIRREPDVTYFPNELTALEVNAQMLDTYTQETSEGYKDNLVDGDPNTFWHTAWSGGVAPLPHWIQLNFDQETELGAFKFYFRQNNDDVAGRPSQWGLEISNDGNTWERVWESMPNLPVTDTSREYTINFQRNYSAKHFRVMILANGDRTYTHLGEISFFKMATAIVDKELEAEEEYYNF